MTDLIPVHPVEEQWWKDEPQLGSGDSSLCLDSWVKTFCRKVEAKQGTELTHRAVQALCHTLVAVRKRIDRLVKERDAKSGRILIFHEYDEASGAQTYRLTETEAIARQRSIPHVDYSTISDEDVLADFIAVNWAYYADEPPG